ncbi:MAG: sigma-54-dependent Fis family transcriptional regulator [Planctomycetes bacterium]|nr:sigma-54-dependent Fis family transcriptional regulator [Planctomycetota bacterium]
MSDANDRIESQGAVPSPNEGSEKDRQSVCADNDDSAETVEETFIGTSAAFESIIETIKTVATRKCSVIISGETGTGKELVARKVHEHSDRHKNIFVPVDCTTLTGQLFESQLFGHVKGAFTGAIDNTLGFFRAANKGTIFLDEISEIPLELQAKLLRVLQENAVTPVGSTQSYPVDIRVLCATNRNLKKMVHDDKFRADLYYRLNVVNLEVPPLRERKEDIILLANYFLRNQSEFYCEPGKKLSARAQKILSSYYWPGNIRELANAMERAYVLSAGKVVESASLPSDVIMADYSTVPNSPLPTLDDAKRKLIREALKLTGGKKLAAAKILNVERRKLNRLIEKFNISVDNIKS